MTDNATTLFRKAALDKLASPEQLDQLVTVADTRGWIAASGLGVVIAAALCWGVFGSVRTEVEAPGILVRESGQVVSAVAPGPGTVEHLLAHPGDQVSRGQPVAILNQDEAALHLANMQQNAADQRVQLDQRQAAILRETDALRRNTEQRRASYSGVIKLTSERLRRLQVQLSGRESLYSKGLISDDTVEQVRVNIAQCQEDIDASRAKLAELDTETLRFQSEADRDLSAIRRAVADADRQAAELKFALADSHAVLAPAAGRITELAVAEGERLAAGALVMNLETEGHRLEAVVYIPTEQGKSVVPGMAVRIAPSTVRKEEFGTMRGQVQGVSAFPSTPQGMLSELQNQNLVNEFITAGAPYEARIALTAGKTPTGYAWSSGSGPRTALTSGTTVKVWVTTHTEAPMNLLLPFAREGK